MYFLWLFLFCLVTAAHRVLPDLAHSFPTRRASYLEDFMQRPRSSRIYYQGKFYDYPINVVNALRNLGPVEAILCGLSFLWVRVRPPKDLTTLEGYKIGRAHA